MGGRADRPRLEPDDCELDGGGPDGRGVDGWRLELDGCRSNKPEKEPKLRECNKGMSSGLGTSSDVRSVATGPDARRAGKAGRRGDRGGRGGDEGDGCPDEGSGDDDALSKLSVVLVDSRKVDGGPAMPTRRE